MKFMKEEEAVSPVIGVILMVAITVILAAVIAAFVFGLGTGGQKTKNVGLTAAQVGTDVVVTVQGGADLPSLTKIDITGDDVAAGCDITPDGTATSLAAGQTNTPCALTNPETANKIIVVGTFLDGSQQVLLDTTI